MYQFSLDAYNSLFLMSIANSPKVDVLADRIKSLNDYHTYAVYKYAARGLFERHKLLLSLQMCVRILQASGQVNAEEWQFFLRGGQVRRAPAAATAKRGAIYCSTRLSTSVFVTALLCLLAAANKELGHWLVQHFIPFCTDACPLALHVLLLLLCCMCAGAGPLPAATQPLPDMGE